MKQIRTGEETARQIYDAAMGGEQGIHYRGVQMFKRPYLWRDDSPTTIKDTFTENFIPTPTLETNDAPKWKRILKIVALFLIVAAIAFAFFVGVMYEL